MEITIYEDDVLWDEYRDAHHDSVLEEEVDELLRVILVWLGDLAGERRVCAAFQLATSVSSRKMPPGSEISSELIERVFDAQRNQESFSLDGTIAHSLSFYLKTFAFLGTMYRQQDTGLDVIETLVGWGDRVRSMPGATSAAPLLEVVSRAARARLDLDCGNGTDMDNFVCLVAIARWPIGKSLDKSILDLPRKTVQNLVSSKTVVRDLNGNLEHKSASEWIAQQFAYSHLFPSADIICSRRNEPVRPALKDPVFVPQVRCDKTLAIEPYLPDFRGACGYEILNGTEQKNCDDYFEALNVLASFPRARVVRPIEAGHTAFATLVGTFVALERSKVAALIENVATDSRSNAAATDRFPMSLVEAVSKLPFISVFPKGHSKKLFRFVSSKWGNFALEPLISSANFYILDTGENRAAFGPFITSSTGPGPSGRNSNLNTIPAFKHRSLLVMRVIDESEAARLLEVMSEKNSS